MTSPRFREVTSGRDNNRIRANQIGEPASPSSGRRARTRDIRDRMDVTGEPYSVAARHVDAAEHARREVR